MNHIDKFNEQSSCILQKITHYIVADFGRE
jgi:hypothetical protein